MLLQRAIPDCELVRGGVLTFLAAGRYGTPADRARARDYLVRAAAGPYEVPERPALALFDAIACQREDRPAQARALAADAAAGFARLGMPLLEAAAREIAGDADIARALYHRCGALYDVRRLSAGSTSKSELWPVEKIAGSSPLSPREREVALLAADGCSNVDIARTLSVTPKTVEKHLSSVYRKTAISSRAKLGAYVATRGDLPS